MIGSLPGALAGLIGYGATPAAIGRMLASRTGPVLVDDRGTVSGTQLWTTAQHTAAQWFHVCPSGEGGTHRIGLLGQQDRSFVIGLMSASILGWDVVGISPRQQDDRIRSIAADLALTAIAGCDDERIQQIAGDRQQLPLSVDPRLGPAGHRTTRTPRNRRSGQLILLSSGTTGVPTGTARRRYGPSLARPVRGLWRTIRPAGGPMMILAPLWHGYGLGMMLLALVGGVPVLLTSRRSSVERSAIAERHRPRTMILVPTQLDALTARWPNRPASLHRVVTGSAPLSEQLCRRALDRLGPRLINLYGSTEAGWATWATPQELAAVPGTIGRPAPGVRVVIIDGELHVDSPLGTSALRPTPTGDRAHRTGGGLLVIDGRRDDLVIIDGNNVALSAVQRALDDQPQIAWSLVRAEPDPVHGHRLVADLRTIPGAELDDVRTDLARSLDWFAVPDLVRVDSTTPEASDGTG